MTERDSQQADDEAQIKDLLRAVGAREEPDAEFTAQTRRIVHAEWREMVADRIAQRRRRWTALSAAASLALAIGIAWFAFRGAPQPSLLVATIARVQSDLGTGVVQASTDEGASWRDVAAGAELRTNSLLRTDAASRVALDVGEVSLRMDHGALLKFVSAERAQLERGRVYVDARPGNATPLVLVTRLGDVRHLGTQYQVELDNALSVSVREGRIAIASDRMKLEAGAGERLRMDQHGVIARERIEPYDASWRWAAQTAPGFQIENQSLSAFLEWVARETGRAVNYASPQARAEAERTILHGSIGSLAPEHALQAVLATTRFTQSSRDTSIDIRL